MLRRVRSRVAARCGLGRRGGGGGLSRAGHRRSAFVAETRLRPELRAALGAAAVEWPAAFLAEPGLRAVRMAASRAGMHVGGSRHDGKTTSLAEPRPIGTNERYASPLE